MLEKLPVGGFKWIKDVSKIDEDFIKNYDENGDIGYFIKVDVKYPTELHDSHSDFPFLPEIMKIDKFKKLLCNLYEFVCCSRKINKISLKSWSNIKKGS